MPRCRECEAKSALINQMRELGKQQAKEIARLRAIVDERDAEIEENNYIAKLENTLKGVRALVNENGL